MTTDAAAELYLAQHRKMVRDRGWVIYNPLNKAIDDLPIIYGFNNGGRANFLHAQLMAEDGTPLGSHYCSGEGYMEHDLGILDGSNPDRHKVFRAHYPDGYQMEFVGHRDVREHPGLQAAMSAYEKLQADAANMENTE